MKHMKLLAIVMVIASCFFMKAEENIFTALDYKDHRTVSKWLKRQPDFNVLNEQGQTVLIKAVQLGNSTLTGKLIAKGVDVNLIDNFGKTALDYAIEKNHKKIVLMLVKQKGMVTTQQNLADVRAVVTSNARWMRALSQIFLLPVKMLALVGIILVPLVIVASPFLALATAFGAGMTGTAMISTSTLAFAGKAALGAAVPFLLVGIPCYISSIGWYDKQAWYTPSLITTNTAVIR